MRKFVIAIALALSACATTPAPPPAGGVEAQIAAFDQVLTEAAADETAIRRAFQVFDGVLHAIDLLRDAGVIVPGTPRAKAVQTGIRETKALLNEASAIQRGVRAGNYLDAVARATTAYSRLKSAIRAR